MKASQTELKLKLFSLVHGSMQSYDRQQKLRDVHQRPLPVEIEPSSCWTTHLIDSRYLKTIFHDKKSLTNTYSFSLMLVSFCSAALHSSFTASFAQLLLLKSCAWSEVINLVKLSSCFCKCLLSDCPLKEEIHLLNLSLIVWISVFALWSSCELFSDSMYRNQWISEIKYDFVVPGKICFAST